MKAGVNQTDVLPARVAVAAGCVVALVGIAVLIGWQLHSPTLKTVFPGLVTMKANTAAGLLLSGLALTLVSCRRTDSFPPRLGAALAAVVVCLGTLTLAEYLLNWDAGIDQLLFRDPHDALDTSRPGQMAPSTAFCFVLTGCGVLVGFWARVGSVEFSVTSALGATLVCIGGVASLGQFSNALFHFHLWNYFWMAIHTALSFVILGAGLLALGRSGSNLGWSLDVATSLGFGGVALGMLIAACVSWGYAVKLRDSSVWVAHTQQVLKEIENVRAGLAELQDNERSFVIQGDERSLPGRAVTRKELDADFQTLRGLVVDNPVQEQQLEKLEQAAQARTAIEDDIISVRRSQGFFEAQRRMGIEADTPLSAGLASMLAGLRDREYGLLVARQQDAEAVATSTFLLQPLCIFLTLTILSLAVFLLNAGNRRRRLAEEGSAQLAEIVNSSNDAIIGKDLEGTIKSWNKGSEKIFGYSPDEMIGEAGRVLMLPGGSVEEVETISRLKRGETVEHFETQRLAKGGNRIDVSVSISPIKEEAGKIVGISVVERDITESKRAKRALEQSEEQFRTMANALPQLAWIADREGFIFWYNQRWFDYTGTTPESMKGWGWQTVHDPEMLPGVLAAWKDALARGVALDMEFPLRAADGHYGWFLTRVLPLRNETGEIVRWFGTNTDLTQKREADEVIRRLNATLEQRVVERTAELEAANKELEAFSYSVSHDLRAPLRAVDGFAQAALEDFGPHLPGEGQRQLQIIRESAQRMGVLIDDLLTFSRLSRAPLVKQPIDTSRQVADILDRIQRSENGRRVEVRLGQLPVCFGTPALLEQVWFNLLTNAFKYTRQRNDAAIEVGCRRDNEANVFFVRDNGVGFDMKYADKLFGVFQRLHRADEFEGTGVGLAIVQRILHRHGEKIWAEAAPKKGAAFYFTLQEEHHHE